MMGRVVGREGLDWKRLGEILRSLEEEFKELRSKQFIAVKFSEEKFSNAIKKIYSELDSIPFIGSPTIISKILHLLNPEIFVMWDNDIRKMYKAKNRCVANTPEGYLAFLKEAQEELKEAFEDMQREAEKEIDEIEREIKAKYGCKTLARIIDEYNWLTAHPDSLINS